MMRQIARLGALMVAVLLLSITVLEFKAEARAGGGRSLGGSRSYSRPSSTYSRPAPPRQQAAPAPGPFQQQAGGGFMRNLAGGMMGGMLGSMLFSSFAGAGTGGGMGSGGGIGLLEILLLAGVGYLLFRFLKRAH